MNKCPFCLGTDLEVVEMETQDCNRLMVQCFNCGMTGPGAEDSGSINEDHALAIEFWNKLSDTMLPVWNPGKE